MVTDVPSVSNFDAVLTQLSLYDAYKLARDRDTTTLNKHKSWRAVQSIIQQEFVTVFNRSWLTRS